jgi:tRNA threonylcarbamoyladenosine biosynthesis protein TsaB
MKVLAIDTTSLAASVAVFEDKILISSAFLNNGTTHSQKIMNLIDQVLKNCSYSINDIDAVAVSNGPGSFTGVRIGISTALGLTSFSKRKRICVSTLKALARNVSEFEGLIVPVMDAKRDQIYSAAFVKNNDRLERIIDDKAIHVEDFIALIPPEYKSIMLVGDGSLKFKNYFEEHFIVNVPDNSKLMQNAISVGIESYYENESEEYHINYLRESQAVEDRKKND